MSAAVHKAEWLRNNLNTGEIYAGLILGQNGEEDYHLVLLPVEDKGCAWSLAEQLAKESGGELPTRREQTLLFANCQTHFEPYWYWCAEVHRNRASDLAYAWCQHFSDGYQNNSLTSTRLHARAVRRIYLK